MVVTLSGIVILVRPVQSKNALVSIMITLFGIVMLIRLWQPAKAPCPMLVTLLLSVALVRLSQPTNALSPMVCLHVSLENCNAAVPSVLTLHQFFQPCQPKLVKGGRKFHRQREVEISTRYYRITIPKFIQAMEMG